VKKKTNVFEIFCCILRGRTIEKLKLMITGIAKITTKILKINHGGKVKYFFAVCLRVLLRVSTPLRIVIRCYETRTTTPGTWDTCGLYVRLFFRWRAAIQCGLPYNVVAPETLTILTGTNQGFVTPISLKTIRRRKKKERESRGEKKKTGHTL